MDENRICGFWLKRFIYLAASESIVYQAFYSQEQSTDEPALKCLIEIERTIQKLSQTPDSKLPKTFEHVDDILQIASDIVELFTGEKA